MKKIKAIYKVQYLFSDLVQEKRSKVSKGRLYQFYTFKNSLNDGFDYLVSFNTNQVQTEHFPLNNQVFYNVSLYDYENDLHPKKIFVKKIDKQHLLPDETLTFSNKEFIKFFKKTPIQFHNKTTNEVLKSLKKEETKNVI